MQDCSSCPSRLTGDAVKEFMGKDFGPSVDACATHGHVLGRPGLDAVSVQKVYIGFGSKCGNYGQPMPTKKPSRPEARVCQPSPKVHVNADGSPRKPPTPEEQAEVTSCRDCSNFIPDSIVRDELGWYLPMCAASGRLLMPGRFRSEPRACGLARPGENQATTEHNFLRDEYNDAFTFGATSNSPVGAFIASGGLKFIEPTEYPTDRPVTPGEEKQGIRAWRRVFSPDEPTKFVDLPIFDTQFFDPVEQAKIPKSGDDEHPEWYVDHAKLMYDLAVETMNLEETPLLIGGAGVGKTELFRYFAWSLHLPFHRISVTRSSEIDDLAGKWLFTDGETRWQDGRVTEAWGKPCVLLVDEPNTGPDEVWQFFRPMTDNSKQLVLDQGRGDRRQRHNWCFFGLAANPSWDVKYVGANEISAADSDRLTGIAMGLPPAEIEQQIIAQRCLADGYSIPVETLAKVMSIAEDIRELTDPLEGTLAVSWGLRPQIKVARKTAWYGLEKAYRRAITDSLDPTSAETILRIVRGYEE